MPKRVQRKRTKGWRMPENCVSVCRPGRFGNPYKVGIDCETSEEAVAMYRQTCIDNPDHIEEVIAKLRGKDLACFCSLDKPCHADVLLELANEPVATPTAEDL